MVKEMEKEVVTLQKLNKVKSLGLECGGCEMG